MRTCDATSPVAVTADTVLPEGPANLLVQGPGGWTAAEVARLADHAAAGGTVTVVDPPRAPAWLDLLGVDLGVSLRQAEAVIDGDPQSLARNLAEGYIHRGDFTGLRAREGTQTLLSSRVQMASLGALTVRSVGAGQVIAAAYAPSGQLAAAGAGTLPAGAGADPMATVLRRLWRHASIPHSQIGVGIIGYGQHGGMGWLHGRAAQAVSGLRLAGIAELDPQRLNGAGARFPDAVLHQATGALLSDDRVDVALIATPPSTHFDLACQAIAAGKHVVVEKPLCFTAAQADELLGAAEDAGVLLTVHQNRRWDQDFQAITRLIAEGRLGQVFNVETFVGGFEHPCTLWHSDRRVSGGRLYDWGAHLIDQTLQIYAGESPVEVSATGHKRVWHDVTNLDQVRVRMRFADGREAEFLDSDILAVRRPKYLVQGTAGTVVGHYSPVVEERVTADEGYQRNEHHHAEGPARLTLSQHHAGWGLQTTQVPGLQAGPFPFHRALADHLQLGDPIPVDPAQIRTVTAVLEAAHASAHDGGRLIRL